MSALYRGIYESIRKSILNGEMKSGQKIPSSRELAASLGVSRNTVLAAFSHLEDEGFLESRHGSGIFVRSIEVPENTSEISHTSLSGRKIPPAGRTVTGNARVSLRAGVTDTVHFPYGEFSRLTGRFYRSAGQLNLSYQYEGGHLPLRNVIASYLRVKRGVQCSPGQIIITNGSQEGIFLAANFFLRMTKNVFVENPSYNVAKNIFRSLGAKLFFINVDSDGMQVSRIPKRRTGMVYVTPSHQFPLGVTMTISRRLELLKKAQEQDLIILEDDYDSDFRYNGEPISSLQGYDINGCVIYLGTFSKVLYPGIRLGYIVIPERYLDDFKKSRRIINQDPAIIQQAVVAEFMRSGRFYRHLKKMHGMYMNRRVHMEGLIKKYLSEFLELQECHSGLHLVARVRNGPSHSALRESLLRNGIDVGLVSDYCEGPCSDEALLLGFAALSGMEIEKGVEALMKFFRSL